MEKVLTGTKCSIFVPVMKDPIFCPRELIPESSNAKNDNSINRRVVAVIDFASVFPTPNSTLSNFVVSLRNDPPA